MTEFVTKKFHIALGDCLEKFRAIPDNSIHLIVTDPPYFIDGMSDDWDHDGLSKKSKKADVVGGLPVGMKFDKQQGVKFQAFMELVSAECYRVLKPGGFYIAFSQARLYHRLGMAAENVGFEIRDALAWKYEGQAKAFTQDHFVRKDKKLSAFEKDCVIKKLGGRKTPQLKPQMEPMVLAQKPKEGTFVDNWLAHETGLVDTTQSLDGKFPGNIMEVRKPGKSEKGAENSHMTVKPVALIEHLIQLFSVEGQTVLDPFMGSGTTAIAAMNVNRFCIGFEKSPVHFNLMQGRLQNVA